MVHKHQHTLEQFPKCLPDLQKALTDLDSWSIECRFPHVTITELFRTASGNAETYLALYRKLKSGEYYPASKEQEEIKRQVKDMTEEQMIELAQGRNSWHIPGRAVDLRSKEYSAKQLKLVEKKLHQIAFNLGYGLAEYELLVHDITAPHIHFALKPREPNGWR